MSNKAEEPIPSPEERDPARERIQHDRKPGEMDSAMDSGSEDGDISATERFEGELTRAEALKALAPEREKARARK